MRFLYLLLGAATLLPAQTLSLVSGNGQIVQEQFLTSAPFVVQAKDAGGNPVAGVPVTWSITQGSGTLEGPATTPTDANGLASLTLLATGVAPGTSFMPVTVAATAGASSVNFVLTTVLGRFPNGATAAPPLEQLLTPDPITGVVSGTAGSTVPGAVRVLVIAQSGAQAGQPIANVGVRVLPNADPAQPSASCSGPGGIALTDVHGVATCDLVLGPRTGSTQLTVKVGEVQSLPPFTLQVTAGPACTFAITPLSQSFTAGGGSGIANVTTAAGCGWTATANSSFIGITSQNSGTGNGTLTYSVTANPGASRNGTLTIAGQTLTVTQAGAAGPQPLTITTPSGLPLATVGSAYSVALGATGGSGNYAWALTGSLPQGLSLSSAGVIAGTPATAGTFTFGVKATDTAAGGATQSQTFSVTVLAAGSGLAITNGAFPPGAIGTAYRQTLTSAGGCSTPFSPVPSFRLASGTLPPGLSVQQVADRVYAVTGTPTTAGTFSFTLGVSDACGAGATANYTIAIPGGAGTGGGGAPTITATPASLQFTVQLGSVNAPGPQVIAVDSTSPIAYTATAQTVSGGNWLVLTNAAGTTPGTLVASVANLGQLGPGVYTGAVTITSAAANNPVTVPVTLTVSAPATLAVNPTSIAVTLPNSGITVSQQAILVSSGGAPLNFTATASTADGRPWLSVSPNAGTTTTAVLVIINANGLPAGQYTGTVVIVAGSATQAVSVSLNVTTGSMLMASPRSLTFAYGQGAVSATQIVSLSGTPGPIAFTVSSSTAAGGAWLFVSPTAGVTPASVTVLVNPAELAAGSYSGLISVQTADPLIAPVNIPVLLTVAPAAPAVVSVTNAASFQPAAVAPGEFVTLFGSGLGVPGGALATATAGFLDTTTGETRVLFDGIAAPMIYASATQVSAIVPYEVAGRAATVVQVEYRGVRSNGVNVRVAEASPAIFMLDANAQGAILNQDGSVNSNANGAVPGTIVSLYGTGAGQVTPGALNGQFANGAVLRKPVLPVRVLVNGADAEILYAGDAPGLPSGMIQVNARLPQGLPSGLPASVQLQVGEQKSPLVNVGVK